MSMTVIQSVDPRSPAHRAGLRVGEIAALAKIWSQFNREENPALTMGQEEAEALKKN